MVPLRRVPPPGHRGCSASTRTPRARSSRQSGLTQPPSSRGHMPAREARPPAPARCPLGGPGPQRLPAARRRSRPHGGTVRHRGAPTRPAALPGTRKGVRSAARRFESWAVGVGFSLLLLAFFFFYQWKLSQKRPGQSELPRGAALPSQLTAFCPPRPSFRSIKKQRIDPAGVCF